MERSEKLQMLQKLSERDFTKKFLIPLYESEGMGCKNVEFTHKQLEFGKDIIYYKEDEYGRRIYTGVQVKRTKITTDDIDTLNRQISEAFGEQFNDPSDHIKKSLDRFVVVTSNEFLEDARQSLSACLRGNSLDKNVTYIEGKQLITLLERHLPSAFWDEYDYCNRYFNAMKIDFETIKDFSAIGQKEPVPLENIYISLRLIEPEIHKEWKISLEKENDLPRRKRKRLEEERISRAKVSDIERVVKDYDKLVFLGVPGSGKTTLLRHLALKYCKENLEKQENICVPILFTLQGLSDSGKDLKEYIDDVFEKYQFPKAKEFIHKDLKEGRCKILLDGFDELATKEKQDQVAEKIQKFIDTYPKNQIIVTSRIAGYHDELKGFTKLELMEFDDKQIEQFVNNWFGKINAEKAKSMLNAIKENEKIKVLARNPLMISIIAIIYEEDRKLPQRRAALYNRCIEVLLSKWDIQKKLKNVYPSEKKEFILKKLAFYAHNNNKKILTEKEILKEMANHFPRVKLKAEDAKPFLDEIWQRSYLLRQISRDSYDFLHLSFQEYFTALELKDQEDELSTIIKYWGVSWWEEPILLYVGINKDATALIKRIKIEVPEDIFYSNLLMFGKSIGDGDFTESLLKEEIVNDLWHLYKTTEFSSLKNKIINILGQIKPENIVELLIKDLKSKEKNVQTHAAEVLAPIGNEKAIEPLIEVLNTSKDRNVLFNAAFAITNIGSEKAIDPLIKAFTTSKKTIVKMHAAFALGSIGSEKAIDPLIKAFTTSKKMNIQRNAAFALVNIGGEKSLEPLIEAFTTSKEKNVQWITAFALGMKGYEKAIEPLIESLTTSKDMDIQLRSVLALGNLRNEIAIKPLVEIYTTSKKNFMLFVVEIALDMIGNEKAVEHLIEVFTTSKDKKIRLRIISLLGKTGSEKAVEVLIEAFTTSKNKKIRASIVQALGNIGSEKAVEPLTKALTTSRDKNVQWNAAYALGMLGDKKAIEPMILALTTSKEADIRSNAAYTLGNIGNEKAIIPLIEALSNDKDANVRFNAAKSLGLIGDERVIEPLKKALKYEGELKGDKVKDEAFVSLEKISRKINNKIIQ